MHADRPSPEDLARAAGFVRRMQSVPYREGAQGGDAVDCWSLLRICQRELFGRSLSVAGEGARGVRAIVKAIESELESGRWLEVSSPAHGDAATLSHQEHPHHVGTWLACDRGALLHCVANGGVLFQGLPVLRASGWLRIQWWRYTA